MTVEETHKEFDKWRDKESKIEWEIMDYNDAETCECLNCGYVGSDWAESDFFILDEGTGEREVFCPKCKSDVYFLTYEERG